VAAPPVTFVGVSPKNSEHDKLPIRMLHDRVLVRHETGEGERRSGGGILIPATAAVGRRLAWAEIVAVGQNVRTVEVGDRVLYDPEDRAEVEVRGVAEGHGRLPGPVSVTRPPVADPQPADP
jgi:chaperonin GroES